MSTFNKAYVTTFSLYGERQPFYHVCKEGSKLDFNLAVSYSIILYLKLTFDL